MRASSDGMFPTVRSLAGRRGKTLYVVGDASPPTQWSATGIGQSGITGAGLASAGSLPAIPADVNTPANAAATQAAVNVWAAAVGCNDPVFPVNNNGVYDQNTQEAVALFQSYENDPAGGALAAPITIDGLTTASGTGQTWPLLAVYGAAPAAVTPAPVVVVAPGTTQTTTTTTTTTTSLSPAAKVAIGVAAGGVGLAGLWWLHKMTKGTPLACTPSRRPSRRSARWSFRPVSRCCKKNSSTT